MPYKTSQKVFNIFFYGNLILSVVYYPIHFFLIDLPNISSNLSKLDAFTKVPDAYNAGGQIILLILLIGIYILSIYYLVIYDKDSEIDWRDKILSISLFCMIICSLSSIIIVYDFIWNFVMIFPLDESILPVFYFTRLLLVIIFIISIILISIGTFLLILNHFQWFNQQGFISMIPFIIVLLFNIFGLSRFSNIGL